MKRRIRKTSEDRQREVVDAAIKAIGQKGLSNTTLADIAKRAGIGYGNLSFRFKNKEALLVAALNTVVNEYGEVVDAAAAAHCSDTERLNRVVAAAFTRSLTTRNKLAVWAAFWAESHTRTSYRRLFSAFREREAARMTTICQGVIQEKGLQNIDASTMAAGVNALLEGLWSQMAHGSEIDREEGLRIAMVFVLSITK